MEYGLGHQVYQDIYLDLCEMRCYIAVNRHKLVIDLEPELFVEVTLCPRILASNRMALPYVRRTL